MVTNAFKNVQILTMEIQQLIYVKIVIKDVHYVQLEIMFLVRLVEILHLQI